MGAQLSASFWLVDEVWGQVTRSNCSTFSHVRFVFQTGTASAVITPSLPTFVHHASAIGLPTVSRRS